MGKHPDGSLTFALRQDVQQLLREVYLKQKLPGLIRKTACGCLAIPNTLILWNMI